MRVSALILVSVCTLTLSAPALAGGGGGGGGSGGSASGSTASNRIQAGFTIAEDGTITSGSGNSSHGSGHGVSADDGHGEAAEDHGEAPAASEGEIDPSHPRLVSLPALVVPLTQDNRLTGYGFVSVRFTVASGFDHWDIREHAHFALDAIIRASHRTPVSDETGETIDRTRAEQVWRAALSQEFGEGVVDRMTFEVPDIRRVGR